MGIDTDTAMDTVTVSPKFQIVIPKPVRDALDLRPGQKVQVVVYDNRIELVPVRAARDLRGFLHGIDTEVPREDDRV
jgi:AbrB family looped-hinge helix DNA binding protein